MESQQSRAEVSAEDHTFHPDTEKSKKSAKMVRKSVTQSSGLDDPRIQSGKVVVGGGDDNAAEYVESKTRLTVTTGVTVADNQLAAASEGRRVVERLKKLGRMAAAGTVKRRSRSSMTNRMDRRAEVGRRRKWEEPKFQPEINEPRHWMVAAKEYLKADVFARLTEGVLRRAKDADREAHLSGTSREAANVAEEKKRRQLLSKVGPADEPKWWRIQRFLWHQNLCEERRLQELDDRAQELE